MGLFSRHRRTVVEPIPATWRPLHPQPLALSGDAADMPGGQAWPVAYQVAFGNGDPGGAVITVSTYAAYAYSPHGPSRYRLKLCYRYTSEAHPGWSHTGYIADPLNGIWTAPNLDDAIEEAESWATVLASGNPDSMGNLPEVFGWDGKPFPC